MAHYGTMVEYGLHVALLLIGRHDEARPSARDLARFQGLPADYVAKVLTKLEKAGIVASEEGRRGGFCLARDPAAISALDVVDALEGNKPLFNCREVRRNCILFKGAPPAWATSGLCGIHGLMRQAEAEMRAVLAGCSLADLAGGVVDRMPRADLLASRDWFETQGRARVRPRAHE